MAVEPGALAAAQAVGAGAPMVAVTAGTGPADGDAGRRRWGTMVAALGTAEAARAADTGAATVRDGASGGDGSCGPAGGWCKQLQTLAWGRASSGRDRYRERERGGNAR